MCGGTLWLYFRNSWRETIMEYLIFLKCVLSFIFLVKMSLGFIIPGICLTSTSFEWWHLQTMFNLRFKCLITFEVTEAAHWTAAFLSLYIFSRACAYEMPMSLAQCCSDWSLVVHSLVVMISASQELKAVWFWWIDLHAIGPSERQMRKTERERNLNSSRGVPSSTTLPYLPPNLASQKTASWWHSDG